MNYHCRSDQVWHVFLRDLTVLPAHPHVHPQLEWAISTSAFPTMAGTLYWPWRDGRLSRLLGCEVAPAKIRTCNLVITNLAFYHTATSAWLHRWYCCAGHAGVMGTAAAELQHFQVGAEEEPAGSARRSQLLRLVVQTEPRVQVHESLGRLSDWKWVSCWFMLWLVTSNLMM